MIGDMDKLTGPELIGWMDAHGWITVTLARRIGTSPQTVARWRAAAFSIPGPVEALLPFLAGEVALERLPSGRKAGSVSSNNPEPETEAGTTEAGTTEVLGGESAIAEGE